MKELFSKTILVIIISSMTILQVSKSLGNPQMSLSPLAFSSTANSETWEIFDRITPTLDEIEWFEEGVHPGPPSWISDGRWYDAHSRQILVKSGNYIFATFYETFNWTAVNESFEKEGWHIYPSFDDFRSDVINNPSWWLLFSWNIPGDWLGISLNKTKVVIEFDPNSFTTHIEISCHITNIPGYFVESLGQPMEIGIGGEKLPKPLFAGLDLTAIYIGDFDALQLHDDYGPNHGYYKIYFKAPANLLSQCMDTYSLSLGVYPPHIGQNHNAYRFINISMPSDTEVKSTSPSNISTYTGNIAMFAITQGDRYPQSFQVTSGPPEKDFTEIFLENVTRWVTEPEIWIALGTAIAAIYATFRGKQIWGRQKTYYRLYRSMVNLYDHYSQNFTQFNQEMENLSKSITKYFIEGKINDDQFDKLLTRRDDFIERAKKLQQKG
jgi:hypothetical protein